MPDDARRYPCPVCGRALLKLKEQCGLCRSYCTEERVREAETTRKKALLAAYRQPALEEFL